MGLILWPTVFNSGAVLSCLEMTGCEISRLAASDRVVGRSSALLLNLVSVFLGVMSTKQTIAVIAVPRPKINELYGFSFTRLYD